VAPTLEEDRVRGQRWEAEDTDLETVMAHMRELHRAVTEHDAGDQDHPHPRNCVLNLVVGLDDKHRVTACDKLVAGLATSHPLRAILVHLHGGGGPGMLDAQITTEAHKLVSGFPVQREQVLLHVRGEASHHLSSLILPLLVDDVPTYLWWSGRHRLSEAVVQDAISFSDVLVVDSARFEHPIDELLELAQLVTDPDAPVGVADFRWGRLRPWQDAISHFFGPAGRRELLSGLREVTVEAAGTRPNDRVGGALLFGWMASALRWRSAMVLPGDDATSTIVDVAGEHPVRVTIRSVPHDDLRHGELLTVRLAGRAGRRTFTLSIEHDTEGDDHAHVTVDLDGGEPVLQRLALPRLGDPELLTHALWSTQRDPVFHGALRDAAPLLAAMREHSRSGGRP
jgi:glucose-6-phosphate dehydrogenase assembly protein OpcA